MLVEAEYSSASSSISCSLDWTSEMSSSLKCLCYCHKDQTINHKFKCCVPCPKCGENIRIGNGDQHANECDGKK